MGGRTWSILGFNLICFGAGLYLGFLSAMRIPLILFVLLVISVAVLGFTLNQSSVWPPFRSAPEESEDEAKRDKNQTRALVSDHKSDKSKDEKRQHDCPFPSRSPDYAEDGRQRGSVRFPYLIRLWVCGNHGRNTTGGHSFVHSNPTDASQRPPDGERVGGACL